MRAGVIGAAEKGLGFLKQGEEFAELVAWKPAVISELLVENLKVGVWTQGDSCRIDISRRSSDTEADESEKLPNQQEKLKTHPRMMCVLWWFEEETRFVEMSGAAPQDL